MRPRVVGFVVGGLVLLVGLGAAGALAWSFLFAPSSDDAVELVPEDAFIYGNVFFDPSTAQKRAFRDLLEHFDEAPSPEEARNKLVELLNEEVLAQIDANFEDDVEPWVGDQVAGFALAPEQIENDPAGAMLLESEDDDGAQEFIDKIVDNAPDADFSEESYEGVDYVLDDEMALGIVGDFVVAGNEEGFRAVVDVESGARENLSESDTYNRVVDNLTDDRVLTFYIDGRPFFDLAEQAGEMPPGFDIDQFRDASGPAASALFFESDKVVLESTSRIPEEGFAADFGKFAVGSELLGELPAESWGAFSLQDSGELFGGLYDFFTETFAAQTGQDPEALSQQFEAQTGLNLQDDIFAWMGDLGLFVEGTTLAEIGGGVIIETTDAERSTATVQQIGELLGQQGAPVGPPQVEGLEGFSIQDPSMPQPVNFVSSEDRVVVAYGNTATEDALESESTLESNETFQTATEALGDGFQPAGFFDAQAIVTLVENVGGVTDDPVYEEDVKPWLEPLSYLTFGGKEEDGRVLQRLVIAVE